MAGRCIGWSRLTIAAVFLGAWGALAPSARAADDDEDDVLLEFHFLPIPNAQIAIWLTDASGVFVRDVFVTQATGTLGIGNRPGLRDFLSGWRFPYGPRVNVLPIWAYARGKQYPQLIFHDDDHLESIGWHEDYSSPEPYFCTPLMPEVNERIATDVMSCPSPKEFQTDKGQFSGAMTVYPPRGDLTTFEDGADHPDTQRFAEINDLDAITQATPVGSRPAHVAVMLPADRVARGPLTAWLEIHVEGDENSVWSFDREDDHHVDPEPTVRSFGVPYLGQPSVVYAVTFDPELRRFSSTDTYAGYGEIDGRSGTVHPPDDTMSTEGGSGADRLALHARNGIAFRFGVFSHGTGTQPIDPNEPDWGACTIRDLPAMTDVVLEPIEHDRVRIHFTVPDDDHVNGITSVRVFYRHATEGMLADDNASSAIQRVPTDEEGMCGTMMAPGITTWCDLGGLFGSSEYQIGIRYEDDCANRSSIVASAVTTPQQKFEVVDGLCFVATAAYGAPWIDRVRALRWFRDGYLASTDIGRDLLRFYNYASPGLADMIAETPLARGLARVALEPLAQVALALTAPTSAGPPTSR